MNRSSSPWWKQPLWWKSKEFLWSLFAGCFVVVGGISGPLLYLNHVELRDAKQRLNNMKTYVTEHESTVKLVQQGLRPPSEEELQALKAKVPTEINVSRVVNALRGKASAAGVKWKGIRFAAKESELNQLKDELKISDIESIADLKTSLEHYLYNKKTEPKKSLPPHMSVIYSDVYIDANPGQLKSWFQAIKDLDRIIHIREWENLILNQEENKLGNTRVRLMLYVYLDPKLQLSPSMVGNTDGGTPVTPQTKIEILPKPTKKEDLLQQLNPNGTHKEKNGTINQDKSTHTNGNSENNGS
ncbi:hypothetical protein [Thermoflavimicrobium dichotomicum]|uniref:Uncharacterized protein n=1 Tax=Thermoflavimicrobium dichotomicum TaxID=46223 RepID=A0A1I3R9F6_9BACL|nr:hypothetical protein [Thermoflavimicrobium dichotomicum]SFJ41977.1 hypothetical protein SAMN05421852_10947 [Thermoflavimicrobium dichotomicum]